MNTPVINIFRSKTEAFYFKNSQQNRFYAFTGVQLLPNNPVKYIQVTDTPDGINLEDWTVNVVNVCTEEKTDITASFMVEKLTNSLNGNPQLFWSLENVPLDFGYELIYLEITQAVGETFYSQPFLLTAIDSEKTTQFHYKAKKTDTYQSIGMQTWFRNITRNEELTQYYEASTRNTVTQAVKVNKLEKHFTELMSLDLLNHLSDILISPYLYLNQVRISLFEAPKFPEVTNQENFGKMEFIVSPNKNDSIDLDSIFPIVPVIPLINAVPNTFNVQNTGNTNLFVMANDALGSTPTTITSVIQTGLTTGTVAISGDGLHLVFTANNTTAGGQTFSYTITDSLGNVSTANVTLNVSAIAPSLDAVDDTVNLFNSGAQNIYPLSNDSIGVAPTTITSINTSGVTTGALTIAGDGQSIVFSPNGVVQSGQTFTYTITDSTSATNVGTITLNVISSVVTSYTYQFSIGRSSSGLSCNEITFNNVRYSDSNALDFGNILYINSDLSTPFSGGNLWYQEGIDGVSYQVNSAGEIINITNCVI